MLVSGHQYSGQQQYSATLWRLNNAQLVKRGLECAKKEGMEPCFHANLNVAAGIETCQIRQRFSNLLLSKSLVSGS